MTELYLWCGFWLALFAGIRGMELIQAAHSDATDRSTADVIPFQATAARTALPNQDRRHA
jgi:hypothetical protein